MPGYGIYGKRLPLVLKKTYSEFNITDIELDDMGGWELIEEIKLIVPDIPLIVVTARPPGIEDMTRLLWYPIILPGL